MPKPRTAPGIYLPHAQSPMPGMVMVVRTAGDPIQLVPELPRCLRGLDPDIPISEVQTVPEIMRRWLRDDRMLAFFLAIRLLGNRQLEAIMKRI